MEAIKWFIKSNHFWMWLIYIIGLIGYRYYDNYMLTEQNELLRLLESCEAYFLFLAGSGMWLFMYVMIIMNSDIEDI